jgi:flagellar hook-associated protein 2
MGTIVTSGVGSGLDISGLVTKLVEAEGAPKKLQLDKQEAKAQAKLSALGSLRSALSTLRDSLAGLKSVDKFQARQASLSSQDFLSATAATTAVAGSYSVEVQRLASAHKLQSGPFASTSTAVGTGTLNIATGGQAFAVEIDGENQSLADIAAAINASPAGAKVTATVISGASDARLTLSARESGEAHAISLSQTGGNGGLAALVYPPSGGGLSELKAALDSRALVDGVLVTSSTNTISGAIAGVDLTLNAVNEVGETTTLSVSQGRAAARKAVDDFVKGYNGFVDALKTLTGYNVDTRQGGPLFGDSGVRNIMDQLRRELTTNVAGAAIFDSLSSIGVTAQLDGKLTVDAANLDTAFDTNFDAVGDLFASKDEGLAVKLDALLERHLASQGAIESRTDGLKSTIDAIGERREALADRLTALQARYTKQFNALDGLLSQLQGTSNFLNQQLSNLPGSAPLNRSRR